MESANGLQKHYHVIYSYSGRRTMFTSDAAPNGRWSGHKCAGSCIARMDADLLTAAVMVSEWTEAASPPRNHFLNPTIEVKAEHLVR